MFQEWTFDVWFLLITFKIGFVISIIIQIYLQQLIIIAETFRMKWTEHTVLNVSRATVIDINTKKLLKVSKLHYESLWLEKFSYYAKSASNFWELFESFTKSLACQVKPRLWHTALPHPLATLIRLSTKVNTWWCIKGISFIIRLALLFAFP